jgi:hypothetical protein
VLTGGANADVDVEVANVPQMTQLQHELEEAMRSPLVMSIGVLDLERVLAIQDCSHLCTEFPVPK